MKILVVKCIDPFYQLHHTPKETHINQIKEVLPSVEIQIVEHVKEEIDKHLVDCDSLVAFDLDKVDFRKAANLKWLHLTGAGADHVPEFVLRSNVLVTTSIGVAPIPIAEHVFAMILAFCRNLHLSLRNQLQGKWIRNPKLWAVSELCGQTISIFGLGRVGRRVAEVSRGFNTKVLGLARVPPQQKGLVDEFYTPDQIDTVLERSDHVVLCLPLTKETHHIIDYNKLKKMKSSGYLINVGRGKLVNEKDLIRALKEKVIKGAGLDVFEEEPLPETSELWGMENVLITAHYAGLTPYYTDRAFGIFVNNFRAFLKNEKGEMINLLPK